MTPSDDDLLERARQGEEPAFDRLVGRHREAVVRLAHRFLHDESEAMDVAQDVFVAAYLKMVTWEAGADFSTWLYRVTVNKAIERSRKRTSRRRLEAESARLRRARGQGQDDASPEESARLRRAMDRLSDRQRAVLSLRFFEGLSVGRTAKALGTTANNVRVTLFKALRALRRLLSRKS